MSINTELFEFVKEELNYWEQVINDNITTIEALTKLNDNVNELLALVSRFMQNGENEHAKSLLIVITRLQESMDSAITVQETQHKLVNGRFKMIEAELNL